MISDAEVQAAINSIDSQKNAFDVSSFKSCIDNMGEAVSMLETVCSGHSGVSKIANSVNSTINELSNTISTITSAVQQINSSNVTANKVSYRHGPFSL